MEVSHPTGNPPLCWFTSFAGQHCADGRRILRLLLTQPRPDTFVDESCAGLAAMAELSSAAADCGYLVLLSCHFSYPRQLDRRAV